MPKPDALAQIQPGLQTRAEVARLLGTPTSIGTLDGERWYYLTRVTENLAFYDPKQIDQRVVVVEFDGNDRVKDIHSYSVDEARRIDFVARETPTQGKDLSVLQQLFGNFGRFERPETGGGIGGP